MYSFPTGHFRVLKGQNLNGQASTPFENVYTIRKNKLSQLKGAISSDNSINEKIYNFYPFPKKI